MGAPLSKDFTGAHDGRAVEIHPGRLWSLWEMFELNASEFLQATSQIASLSAWIASRSSDERNKDRAFYGEARVEDEGRAHIRSRFKGLATHLDALGARITAMAAQDAEAVIERHFTTWANVRACLDEINNTLRRELSQATVLVLDPKERSYFAPNEPHFGPVFAAKFQSSAVFEIDEAAKCFALGRPTASVFHLMRIMEIGIHAVTACLGVQNPVKSGARNWGNILSSIKVEIDCHSGTKPTKRWSIANDGEFFAGSYGFLDAVRIAWRNPTMHVENKYLPDEAETLFVTVRGFMKNLALRMDEDGNPRA